MTKYIMLAWQVDIDNRTKGLEQRDAGGVAVEAHDVKPGLIYQDSQEHEIKEIKRSKPQAADAGVDLDEAFGDKKPSPPGAGIGDKEPRGSAEIHAISPPKLP